MDGIDEDDGYSDDDLDALPVHAFHELQQDAIRSTQQPHVFQDYQEPSVKHSAPAVTHGHLGGFDRLAINGRGRGTQQQPSSDYGDFDDEMLDGEIFDTAAEQPTLLQSQLDTLPPAGECISKESWRQQQNRVSSPAQVGQSPQPFYGQRASPIPNGLGHLNRRIAEDGAPNTAPIQVSPPDNSAVLQAKLEELAHENERLKRDYDAAKTDAFSKTGEIAIVRAKRLKEKQEEEKRLADERKLWADEMAKYNAEVQRYKAELQKVTTDKAFVENDLAREAEQRKGLQKNAKAVAKKAPGKENVIATPKKKKDSALGDGFNDDEVQVQSPPKLALRSKPATPKAGAKRKRKPTENSPLKPLHLSQTKRDTEGVPSHKGVEQQSFEAPAEVPANEGPKTIIQYPQPADDRYEVYKTGIRQGFMLIENLVYPESLGSPHRAWSKTIQ